MKRIALVLLAVVLAAAAGHAQDDYGILGEGNFYRSQDPSLSLTFDRQYLDEEFTKYDLELIESLMEKFKIELEGMFEPDETEDFTWSQDMIPMECRPCCYTCTGPDDGPMICYGLCCTYAFRASP